MATICKYCIMENGIKGSDLEKNDLKTGEDLINHIESEHHIAVQRENETVKRMYEKIL